MSEIPRNRFLASLPGADRDRLAPSLRREYLKQGTSLSKAGHPLRYVYFPEGAVASIIVPAEKGNSVEAGLVGYEGLTGAMELCGNGVSLHDCVIQVAGSAVRTDARFLEAEFQRSVPIRALLLRYNQYLFGQVAQTALCNRVHSIDQRLGRWLLMCGDASGSSELDLTQEYIATMLGVQRSGITLAAQALEAAGAIRYTRGSIIIHDRTKLEGLTCRCYQAVREQERQLPDEPRPADAVGA